MKRFLPLSILFAAALGMGPGCSDPIQSGRIDELGKEYEGVPKGEFHRAGQPCIVCHSQIGPASDTPYTLGGTVFAGPDNHTGVANAEVRMTDSVGTKFIARTNCTGNFFVKADEWDPKFPILVAVAKGGTLRRMTSPIGREQSCATCHTLKADRDPYSTMPPVYLFGGEETGSTVVPCPVPTKVP